MESNTKEKERILDILSAFEKKSDWKSSHGPLRFSYGPQGELVQILDDHNAPITSEMWKSINIFFSLQESHGVQGNGNVERLCLDSTKEENVVMHEGDEALDAKDIQRECDTRDVEMSSSGVDMDEAGQTTASPISTSTQQLSNDSSFSLPSSTLPLSLTPRPPPVSAMVPAVEVISEIAEMQVVANEEKQETEDDTIGELFGDIDPSQIQTPQELLTQKISVQKWLNQEQEKSESENEEEGEEDPSILLDQIHQRQTTSSSQEVAQSKANAFQFLCSNWPCYLHERLRYIDFQNRQIPEAKNGKCIVYWMRNTPRIDYGNFALEAAMLLAKKTSLPLIVVCFFDSPSSLLLPAQHAFTSTEAYRRFSYLEVHQKLSSPSIWKHPIPFYGFVPSHISGMQKTERTKEEAIANIIVQGLRPHLLVTDESFHHSKSVELQNVLQWTHVLSKNDSITTKVQAIFVMDNTSFLPLRELFQRIQQKKSNHEVIDKEKKSDKEEEEEEEEIFMKEYQALYDSTHGTHANATNNTRALSKDFILKQSLPISQKVTLDEKHLLQNVLSTFGYQQVNWYVVEAATKSTNVNMVGEQSLSRSESAGIALLEKILSQEPTGQPAIQEELYQVEKEGKKHGSPPPSLGGILALLPFVRHGTLCVSYILARLAQAIENQSLALTNCHTTKTTSPPAYVVLQRKKLARLKVLRSRAWIYLARERDYCFYLMTKWEKIPQQPQQQAEQSFNLSNKQSTWEFYLQKTSSSVCVIPQDITTKDQEEIEKEPPILSDYKKEKRQSSSLLLISELDQCQTKDTQWNQIQLFLKQHGYLHPIHVDDWIHFFFSYQHHQWSSFTFASTLAVSNIQLQ